MEILQDLNEVQNENDVNEFYIADEIVDVIGTSKDGVSHLSHLVGAVCGGVFGFICVNQELSTFFINLKNSILHWLNHFKSY